MKKTICVVLGVAAATAALAPSGCGGDGSGGSSSDASAANDGRAPDAKADAVDGGGGDESTPPGDGAPGMDSTSPADAGADSHTEKDATTGSDANSANDGAIVDAHTLDAADGGFTFLRGVNNENFIYTSGYGKSYGPVVTSVASYKYLYSRGVRVVRLQFYWGPDQSAVTGLQDSLGGTLNATYLGLLHQEVNNIAAAGLVAVLDLHSSCRFPGSHSTAICGNGVTIANVQNVWTQLSTAFKGDPGVYAYDIMNEPYSIAASVWQQYSQAMVTAIRNNGDNLLIWVEGIDYSNAGQWTAMNGAPWITDPAKNILYSAHTYPPSSNGGAWTDASYQASDDNWVTSELAPFVAWCAKYSQRCGIGELNFPSSDLTSDWQKWNTLGEAFYEAADKANLTVTFFSANSSWNNPNRVYVHGAGNATNVGPSPPATIPDIDTALTAAQVIEKHLSK